jgi:DNA-directed RNA polymerase specialized sigma24 family protein
VSRPTRLRRVLPRVVGALPPRIRLAAALETLPEVDRLVLSLYLLEGLTALEIAGALKLHVREVEQRRVGALATIARELGSPVERRRAA